MNPRFKFQILPIPRGLMRVLRLTAALLLLLTTVSPRAEVVEERLDVPAFGSLTLQRTSEEPKGVVLFASGMGGWGADVNTVAKAVAALDYVVAGIDLPAWLDILNRTDAVCVEAATELDRLNRLMEQRYPIATHQPPILLGVGAGAALTYAALAQGPVDRFHAGVALDFCPELPLYKPLCPGAANLETATLPDHKGMMLKPAAPLPTTWFVFQNRPACDADAAAQFVRAIPLARLAEIPGTSGVSSGLPQLTALFQWLDPGIVRQVQPDASIRDAPLTEVAVTDGPDRPHLAVMFSGNGGWALLDRAVTAELAKNGLPTVGWDSLSYFWKARQPDEAALALEQVLRRYLDAWKKNRIVLIGFSFGANALPALINPLPQDLQDRIDLVALLSLSDSAAFEFHLNDWISGKPVAEGRPVRPELEKLSKIRRLCIYGADESDPLCPRLVELGVMAERMPGDYHFDDDYPGVAQRILSYLPPLPAVAPPPAKN